MKRCPVGRSRVQTVIMPKSMGVSRARVWLRRHGLKSSKVDRKTNTLRFRQASPSICQPGNYWSIKMGSTGITQVMCCPKRRS